MVELLAFGSKNRCQVASATPLPAALPLFGSVLAGAGFFGWCRKRRAQAATA
jgi:hypothetical protein